MKHPNSTLGIPVERGASSVSVARLAMPDTGGRETLSLDGEWQLAFDPENRGKHDGWASEFPRDAVAAPVPAVWEVVRPGYDGVGWYRRVFTLPAGWDKRSLKLRFGAAQYFAEVWLNGARLGEHEGGFLPFEFPVSKRVRDGENEIVVRVINPPMNHEIEGFRCGAPLNQGPIPVGKAGWYYNFGGLWQSVELLATSGAWLTRIVPEPSLEPERVAVKIDVELDVAAECEIECEIAGMEGRIVVPAKSTRRRLKSGVNRVNISIPLPGARRWSLDDPYLHVARVTVRRAGRIADAREIRFGMREFTAGGDRFLLNGRVVILKGFLHQGSYPRTLVRPENRGFAERELRAVKDRGFNFVRAHMLPPLPEWLDLCDEIGLLVMNEPPIGWIEHTEHAERRCWREIKGLVERDAHHASIVMWCLMNEVFHLLGFTPKVVIGMTARWLKEVRRMDPTRVIIDVSGGHGFLPTGGAGDMLPDTAGQGLTAMMANPGEGALRPVLDAHVYREFPVRDATFKHFRTVGADGDRLFFLTEYGAPPVPPMFDEVLKAYSPADRRLGLEDYRLHADFAESLRERFKHPAVRAACRDERSFLTDCNRMRAAEMFELTTALRSNPRVAGYCFCQLADASGELFGALDVWRRPKPMMEALAAASGPGALGVFANPRAAVSGTEVTVEVFHPGGEPVSGRAGKGEWALELHDESGRLRKRWSGSFRPEKNGAPVRLLVATFNAPARVGAWRLVASGSLGEIRLQGGMDLRVLPTRPRLRGTVAVNGVTSGLARALAELGTKVEPFGNNFRFAELPVFMDLSSPPRNRQHWFEELGQLRKVLQVGGCAVVFDPEMALVAEVIPEAAVGMQPMMRPVGYATPSPVFGGLPSGGLMDFAWAELGASRHDRADDVLALGGEVLAGGLSFNMWTRPAEFQHGASLYTLPVGRGTLVVCHHRAVAAREDGHPAGDLLLAGLFEFAKSRIKVSDTMPLLSRCVDSFPAPR